MKKKLIILSGGFDPVHKGHIRMFKAATESGKVFVGLNSDEWLIRKKGRFFMPYNERKEILESIQYINYVDNFNDDDNTACDLIKRVVQQYNENYEIYFGNGGDRNDETTPEINFCNDSNIQMLWDLGGKKIQSSSELIKKWKK